MATVNTIGNAGVLFDIIENNITTATGTITQEHKVPTSVAQLTVASTDLVYSVTGYVTTSSNYFNLSSINNYTGSDTQWTVVRNSRGVLATVKQIVIFNSTTGTNILYLGSTTSVATSFFPSNGTFTDYVGVEQGTALVKTFTTGLTFGTASQFKLTSNDATKLAFQMWILGTS